MTYPDRTGINFYPKLPILRVLPSVYAFGNAWHRMPDGVQSSRKTSLSVKALSVIRCKALRFCARRKDCNLYLQGAPPTRITY